MAEYFVMKCSFFQVLLSYNKIETDVGDEVWGW